MKGKDWVRLRVGFFMDDREAAFLAKEIMAILLNIKDSWAVKVRDRERRRFGG